MDGKNSKKKYESPMIIQLGQVPVAEGAKPSCTPGSSATNNCNIGYYVAGNCGSGTGGKVNAPIPEPEVEKIEPNYEKIEPRIQPRISP